MRNCNGVKNPIVTGSIELSREEEEKQVDETLFKQMMGSLMYCVCLISRFMSNPKEVDMLVTKRILRYI